MTEEQADILIDLCETVVWLQTTAVCGLAFCGACLFFRVLRDLWNSRGIFGGVD